MNKICTSIEQSKKLAEILPPKSNDLWWNYYSVTIDNTTPQIIHIDEPWVGSFNWENKSDNVPCWSLTALLDVIPVTAEYKDMFVRLRIDKGHIGHDEYAMWYDDLQTNLSTDIEAEADNFVDACYEIIVKLHELNIL